MSAIDLRKTVTLEQLSKRALTISDFFGLGIDQFICNESLRFSSSLLVVLE